MNNLNFCYDAMSKSELIGQYYWMYTAASEIISFPTRIYYLYSLFTSI